MTEEQLEKFCQEVMSLGYGINKDLWRKYFKKLLTDHKPEIAGPVSIPDPRYCQRCYTMHPLGSCKFGIETGTKPDET